MNFGVFAFAAFRLNSANSSVILNTTRWSSFVLAKVYSLGPHGIGC